MGKKKSSQQLKSGLWIYLFIGVLVFILYLLFFQFILTHAINKTGLKNRPQSVSAGRSYDFLQLLEDKVVDLLMRIKLNFDGHRLSMVYGDKKDCSRDSKAIMVIAVDEQSLTQIGPWPFKRLIHKKLTDYFTRQRLRENTLFFDHFFMQPDLEHPENDYLFIEAIRNNKRVVLNSSGQAEAANSPGHGAQMMQKINDLNDQIGELKWVSGTMDKAYSYPGLALPLIPYLEVLTDTGVNSVVKDNDRIVRRVPLVGKYLLKNEINFTQLKSGDYADMLYFVNYQVTFNKKDRSYQLKRNEQQVFAQNKLPLQDRLTLDRNRIDTIKKIIDDNKSYFYLEVEKARGQILNNHKKIIQQLKKHLQKSKLEEQIKNQILTVFDNEENMRDTDAYLKDLIDNFKQFVRINPQYTADLNYFIKLYQRCAKVPRPQLQNKSLNEKGDKVYLYDFLYGSPRFLGNQLIVCQEKYFLSIPLVLIARYYHVSRDQIEVIYGRHIKLKNPCIFNPQTRQLEKPLLNQEKGDQILIPIDECGALQVNFTAKTAVSNPVKTAAFEVYSYFDFVKEKPENRDVQNKLVLVGGLSRIMSKNVFATPLKTMFGIEVLANTVHTVLNNNYLKKLARLHYLLILLFISVLTAFIASNKSFIRAYLLTIFFILIYFTVAVVLFIMYNLVLPVSNVIIVALLSLTAVIAYRILTEQKRKKQIETIFSKLVNARVVKHLLKYPPQLEGTDNEITVLFTDIKGLNRLSKAITSRELVHRFNQYLTALSDITLAYNGTLNPCIGDAVMCFWGAPQSQADHAELACRSAIEQLKVLAKMNRDLSPGEKLAIAMGLNSGLMTAAYMGAKGRMSYTIRGDNVELGSRLEKVNKIYGTQIIISEKTYQLVKHKFYTRELDVIRVKGKQEPVKIYELLAERENGSSK